MPQRVVKPSGSTCRLDDITNYLSTTAGQEQHRLAEGDMKLQIREFYKKDNLYAVKVLPRPGFQPAVVMENNTAGDDNSGAPH